MLLRIHRGSHPSQVTSISTRSISSLLHTRPGTRSPQDLSRLRSPITTTRSFSSSSEPPVKEKSASEATVIDIFTRLTSEDEIKRELESSDIALTQDLALKVLRKLESNPDVAKRFFKWVKEENHLTSKSYNMMLRILGGNGLVDEFWGLVSSMNRKGHGLSANVRDKVGDKFQKDGLLSDYVRLRKLFPLDPLDGSPESVCVRVCKVVENGEWSDDVEKRIKDLNVEFGSGLVKMILESLDEEPRKALLFFRWVDESGLFKHDEKTYNAVARVLGKEKFLDRFQNVVGEMRSAGYDVEMETYVTVSKRFWQSKLVKEAVDLFEVALESSTDSNRPSSHCLSLLLKRIVTAEVMDVELFKRAVEAYTKNDNNVLTDGLMKSVLKSLTSADRVAESNEVLKAMKKGGYLPSSDLQSVIASGIGRKGKKDEGDELVDFMEESGKKLDDKAMASLVVGYCDSGDLKKASASFERMVGKEGVVSSNADYAFEELVHAYCNKNQVRDACKLLCAHVKQNQLKPRHSTYKCLVRNLLTKKVAIEGGFEEALSLLPMMKDHGFPPFVDPFMFYFSKTGTSSEAYSFLKAVTSYHFPSISVVMRVFETMLKSARHSEAQDLLSLCPDYIRNDPDVLELFYSMKPSESAAEEPLAASS